MQLHSITPTLQVTDLQQAVDFYQRLGFQKEWIWPEESPTHASVGANGTTFMFAQVSEEATIQKADLYFRVQGIKNFHLELANRWADPLPDLIQTDYGMLDFSIEDPWGHHLTFGEAHGDFQS